jgi:hypothetical protein
MSQTDNEKTPKKSFPHKVTLRNRPDAVGRTSVGANMQLLIDDKPIHASFVKIEVKASRVAKVQIELFAEVEAEVFAALQESKKLKTPFVRTGTGKQLAIYELGNYSPKEIAPTEE